MPLTDIQTDAERAAREFLGVPDPGEVRITKTSETWTWDERVVFDKTSPRTIPAPGPTWPFFGALWGECKRRGLQVEVTGDNVCITKLRWPICHDGDPRHALIRCVCQWLDTQGGSDD